MYTGENCKFCGRHRVEVIEDGSKWCDKCDRNQDTGEYDAFYGVPEPEDQWTVLDKE